MKIRISIYLIHQYQILRILIMCCTLLALVLGSIPFYKAGFQHQILFVLALILRIHISIRISTIISINIGISTFLVLVVGSYSI